MHVYMFVLSVRDEITPRFHPEVLKQVLASLSECQTGGGGPSEDPTRLL